MTIKSSILSLLVVFATGLSGVLAQGGLQGTVTDSGNREVLTGANILVSSSDGAVSRGTNSGIDGTYSFTSLRAGTYTVRVSYVGYNDRTINDVVIRDGAVTRLDIDLTAGVSLNPVVISASKAQEKVTEAPASIQVVSARDIANVSTTGSADYVKGLTAVDVAQQGIASQTVVTRGFNNIFSGSLLVLTDNRITHIPSLRANVLHFIPQTNDDIESVELVLGPAAALYGPNANSGVMHMLTKSPLTSAGTSIGVFGGNQSFFKVQARSAHRLSDRFGLKVSGQYVRASEFELDPNNPYRQQETQARTAYLGGGGDPLSPFGRRIGVRDYDIEKLSIDARADYQVSDNLTAIFNTGFNRANNIDLTGLGAGQAVDWTYSYYQGRILYRNWFFQTFLNQSNSGDTYIIPTGNAIVDKSNLMVSQLQHQADWSRFNFVYGVDYIRTNPQTEGTVNGQYENQDTYQEFGGYLQTKYTFSEKLDLLASFRLDQHSELNDPVFSPRAALVFKPIPNHNFRVTYNRSFSTPSSNNLFLDLLARQQVIFPGYNGTGLLDVRAQGVPKSGFTFDRGMNGLPLWQLNLPAVMPGQPTSDLEFDPSNINPAHWAVIRNVLAGAIAANPNLPADVKALNWGSAAQPGTSSLPSIGLLMFNPLTASVVSDVTDIDAIKPTIYNTFEVGYKGIFNNNLLLSADVYYTKAENFVGPLLVETPTVNMNPNNAGSYLGAFMISNGINPAVAAAVAAQLAPVVAQIPLGVVTPQEAFDRRAVMLTYRNFGEITYWGVDLGFEYLMGARYRLMGNMSYVSEDQWLDLDGNPDFDINLNAPKTKFMLGIGYDNRDAGFDAAAKFRYVGGFPVESGIYVGEVDAYYTLDVNAGYNLRAVPGLRFSANINNLTNNQAPQFAGTPDIGLFATGGITYSF